MFRNVKSLIGRTVLAVDGEIGSVASFYIDRERKNIRYLAVRAGDWLENRDVLISPVSFEQSGLGSGKFTVNLTKDQVNASPRVDLSTPITRQVEEDIASHYNWPKYWPESRMADRYRTGTAVAEAAEVAEYLVSAKDLFKCSIAALDGPAGACIDAVVDDGSWDVRYLVVDLQRYLPGKAVLAAIEKVTAIDTRHSMVHVDLTVDQVKNGEVYKSIVL